VSYIGGEFIIYVIMKSKVAYGGYDVNSVECPVNRASDSLVVETDTDQIEKFLIEFYDDLIREEKEAYSGTVSEEIAAKKWKTMTERLDTGNYEGDYSKRQNKLRGKIIGWMKTKNGNKLQDRIIRGIRTRNRKWQLN
jgi:uncharacterized protein YggL (DUF469 family)